MICDTSSPIINFFDPIFMFKLKLTQAPLSCFIAFFLLCLSQYSCMPENALGSSNGLPVRTFKGLFNPENNEFVDCNTQQVLFLLDSTQIVNSEAKNLGNAANSVYIELTGLAFSSDSMDMGSAYDSVVLVQQLQKMNILDVQSACMMPENPALLTVKEFGSDKLEFGRAGLFAQSEEAIANLLPGFMQTQNSLDSEEATYEYRRGFGTISFVTDTTNTVSEVVFAHPNSNDQYQVRLGMTLADAQKLRPTLKVFKADAESTPMFACPNSHIFYMIDTPKDAVNIDFVSTKIIGIVWRKKSCS
jgi:hypothetical protein